MRAAKRSLVASPAARASLGESSRRRGHRWLWSFTVVAALALVAYQHVVAVVSSKITNEDDTLLWVIARDWGRLRFHQPNLYGQLYGTTVEGIPVEILRRLGLPLATATPLVLGLLALSGWFALALAAGRRGHPLLGVAALATPTVVGAYHAVLVTSVWETPATRLAAMLGTALLVALPRRTWCITVALVLMGLSVAIDASALLLIVPVVGWYVQVAARRQIVPAALVAASAPIAWIVGTRAFYAAHRDYNIHGGTSLALHGRLLSRSFGHLGRFFGLFAPELVRRWAIAWIIPVAVLVALVTLLVSTRQARYAVPAVLALVAVLAALGTGNGAIHGGKFLPAGRILLVLPATLWFLAFLVAESGLLATSRLRRTPFGTASAGLALVLVVATLSLAVQVVASRSRVESFRLVGNTSAAGLSGYSFSTVRSTTRRCSQVRQ